MLQLAYQGEISSSLITDAEGNPKGFLGVVRDISERFLIDEALRVSEKRYRDLFDKSPTSITLVDKSGIIIDCNKSTERLIGYSRQEIIGKSFEKLLTLNPKDLPKLKEKYERILKGEEGKPYKLEIIKKGGEKRLINVINSLLIRDDDIVGFQVIALDITEGKKTK